ncbi:Ubiquitin-like-specific protease 1D [Linum perenne]
MKIRRTPHKLGLGVSLRHLLSSSLKKNRRATKMAAEESSKKRKLALDWDDIHRQNDDGTGSLPVVVSEKKDSPTTTGDRSQQSTPSPSETEFEYPDHYQLKSECVSMPDRKLEESIQRQKRTLSTVGRTLPDKGRKIEAAVKILEAEMEKRKLDRARMGVDGSKQPAQLANPGTPGSVSRSDFAAVFSRKDGVRTDRRVFDKEFCPTGSGLKVKSFEKPSHNARQPFQSSVDISPGSFYSRGERIANKTCNGLFRGKQASKVPSSHRLRPRKEYVDLCDDDDDEVTETVNCEDGRLDEWDDRDVVVVHYTDIECLAPESQMKSPVMNFYIRYLELQVIPAKKATMNFHIFSTFFYSKLKQELSKKGNDKESLIIKFRRWWKGLNLFEKSYVLIPIHEDNHWSLVIICFPEREDKSELFLLHLDSLRLHSSRDIFDVIKRCLREEWKCLHQDVAPPDLQMSENRIFKRLPNICSKSLEVPQQDNEYDCGVFVLLFMERFIEQAPERFKQQHLGMFGKRWFEPSEADSMRRKIRDTLKTEFRKARKEASCPSDGAPSTTG